MSFVKRTKPRSSASRLSSTYNDFEDENGASSSRIPSQPSTSQLGEGDDAGGSNVVFRPRARASKAAAAPSIKTTTTASMEEDEDSGAVHIRRSASTTGKARGLQSSIPKRAPSLRPTSFTNPNADSPSTSLYTSEYLDELKSSTPTLARSRDQSPALGPGRTIEDPMSRISLNDLTRAKYGEDAIPSEAEIRSAKEKRARLRAAAASAGGEDFISLDVSTSKVDDGPHPHSRLMREEDELGDGEEEFAAYTGATERIAIGKKAEEERNRERREMEEMLESHPAPGDVESMDEEELEFERMQLERSQQPTFSSVREQSPYTSASIPTNTPLPTVTAVSTRLQLTLRALEQSVGASEKVINSSKVELEKLEEARKVNELDVEAVEEKSGWFGELEEFIGSLSGFMEEKMGALEEVESEVLELASRRGEVLSRRRRRWIQALIQTLFGIRPSLTQEEGEDVIEGRLELSEADEQSYSLAQGEVASKLNDLFSDVQAPEYLNPAATTSTTSIPPFSAPPDGPLHPRSIVTRFDSYRRLYPEEYSQVWGGLSLAQIYEFYARVEMVLWEPFEGRRGGAEAIGHSSWFTKAADYAGSSLVGGDDEILQTLVGNVLVGKVKGVVEGGGWDPWDGGQVGEAKGVLDVIQTVLRREHVGSTGLVESFLGVCEGEVGRLKEIFKPMIGVGVREGVEQEVGELLEQLEGLLKNLLSWSSVIGLNVEMGAQLEAQNRFTSTVVSLVDDVLHPLLVALSQSKEFEVLVRDTRERIYSMIPAHISTISGQILTQVGL